MAYYNPDRRAEWNYGGNKWTLSRGKISLFLECPRCFYLDNKLGTKRPPGYPLSLNIAVDTLLKKEFDTHREAQSKHPLLESYGLDAVPFKHPDIEKWRDSLKRGISCYRKDIDMTVRGGIDDVWISPEEELIIVDYKATSKKEEVTLDAEWQDSYKRQMEVYQWLFRQNNFKVSDTGYFVYVNGKTDAEAFDGRLEFDVKLIPYTGKGDWIEPTLTEIKKCLDSGNVPQAGSNCEYCPYREFAGRKLQKIHAGQDTTPQRTSKKKTPLGKKGAGADTGTLF